MPRDLELLEAARRKVKKLEEDLRNYPGVHSVRADVLEKDPRFSGYRQLQKDLLRAKGVVRSLERRVGGS